ncbi:MAG: hypothetical protein IJ506_01965 [Clostridia bacterium]|nr:hypothetical protein [Clostridia bacterium]
MNEIEKVDKNFDLSRRRGEDVELEYYDIPHPTFDLYGVFYDKEYGGFLRVPMDVAKSVSPGIEILTKQTSGGRIRFSTDSSVVEIQVNTGSTSLPPHMTLTMKGGFILLEERPRDKKYISILPPPSVEGQKEYTAKTKIDGPKKMRNFILYFPLYGPVRSLKIGLEKDARVEHGKKYKDVAPIVYYGSSITQGGCASRPDNCYQGWIEKWNNVDYINRGFSGNGKGEDEMVDYLISLPCSLFVSDFNHSTIPLEDLRERHPRLYRRYREAHPDTPILILSKTNLWEGNDNAEREKIIRGTYEMAKANGDKNVYFISGHDMFKGRDKMSLCIDCDHPNDHGFYLMAKKIYKKMIEIDEKFK